jgi:ABC-type antimicrobial peptide transport system permease subunit
MIIDFLRLSFIRLFRNKKNAFYVIVLSLFTVVLLSLLTFKNSLINYIDNFIIKNIGFRTISVSPRDDVEDFGYSDLISINHVQDVHSANYDTASVESTFKSDELDGYIDLVYANYSILPTNVVGEKFDADDTGFAICPIDFLPSSEAFNLLVDEKKFLSGYELLNTSFQINYYSYLFDGKRLIENDKYIKEFKIVGIYDAKKVMNPSNTCYISKKDMEEIKSITTVNNENTIYGFMVVVDNIKNVELVLNVLEKKGFSRVNIRSQIDYDIINKILFACNIVVSVIMASIVIIIINYTKKKYFNDIKSIGLLMTMGYSNNIIVFIYLLEIVYSSIFSYLIGLFLFLIIYNLIKFYFLKGLIYSGFEILLHLNTFLISVFVVIFTSIIVALLYFLKNKRKNINLMIEGDD